MVRQKENYGCINGQDVLAAGLLSGAGDVVGAGVEDSLAGESGRLGYGGRAFKTFSSDTFSGEVQGFINEITGAGELPTQGGLRWYVPQQDH